MDSKIVSRELRREVWPFLRSHGFTLFRSRTAWRHLPDSIWLVNFQSFNAHFASVDGCTTFSFAVNLGIYFRALADPGHTVENPKDYECHFRSQLMKRIDQGAYKRPDIWHIENDASNLLPVIDDARTALRDTGLPWFDQFPDIESVVDALANREEDKTWFGVGTKTSPRRKLLLGRALSASGRTDLAGSLLRDAEAEMESIRLMINSYGRNRRAPNSK